MQGQVEDRKGSQVAGNRGWDGASCHSESPCFPLSVSSLLPHEGASMRMTSITWHITEPHYMHAHNSN